MGDGTPDGHAIVDEDDDVRGVMRIGELDMRPLTTIGWSIVTGLRGAGMYERMEEGRQYELRATMGRDGDSVRIDRLTLGEVEAQRDFEAWLVVWQVDYEGDTVEGVFSTEAAAEEYAASLDRSIGHVFVQCWKEGETRYDH